MKRSRRTQLLIKISAAISISHSRDNVGDLQAERRPRDARDVAHRSAVDGVFLNPVEAAANEHELTAINQLQLHVSLVAAHFAIEN